MNSNTRLLLTIFVLLCTFQFCLNKIQAQVKSKVVIESSGSPIIKRALSTILSQVLQEVNKVALGQGNLRNIQSLFTPNGFNKFKKLVEETSFFSTITEYRLPLIETPTGKFEIRGIKVRVNLGETGGDDIQELVFELDFRLFIEDIRFSIESHQYQRLIEQGQKLDDMLYRSQILEFLEDFRTAYNRKDFQYIETVFGDNSLMIVGHTLVENPDGANNIEKFSLSDKNIRLLKLSKKEYLNRLKMVFKERNFVRVVFDEISIVRHHRFPDIYGVTLKQRWNSSQYSDEGYVFLMLDFMDASRPLIHVRWWQSEKFEDETIVGLADFEIIQ